MRRAPPSPSPILALLLSLGACATEGGGDEQGGSSGASLSGPDASSAASMSSSPDSSASDPTASDGSASDPSASDPSASGPGDDTGSPTGACGNAEGQLLLPSMPWNTDVSAAPVAADSQAVIDYLQANVVSDARFQIDFSIPILEATADTPRQSFEPTEDFFDPDCDPAPIPVPEGGHIEGEVGYTCEGDGDCHLIVVDRESCRLYEQWRAGFGTGGGCLAIWELDRAYDETLRGDYCSSADAAGLPIAALLFTADEIAAGEIRHALRFILPNDNIRADEYVRPGTHSTFPTAGPGDAPPYAVRLRLRPDVDISGLNPAAQVVATALATYGMILADGGNITFTAAADDVTTATWEGVGLGPHDLKGLQWSDFEVIDAGPTITWSEGDCTRTPITD